MLTFASRTQTLKSSTIMEISARAAELKAQGKDVVSLAAGEPDFNTPEVIQQAAAQAMRDGITKYTPAPGFLALRQVIAEKVSRENGFPVLPEEIVVTCGAKHAIYLALQCLANEGDAILVLTPAWVSYGPMIELAGAKMIPLPLYEEDGYRINVDRWKNMAIPPNAKGIFINSPNNPTGITYGKEDLIRLVGWALQRNLWILSDEIYEKILYDSSRHVSIASLGPEVRAHTVTISGFSKSYCMTGWRLGWAIADKELISRMSALQSQSNSHVAAFVQWAGITAAKLPQSQIESMVQEFDKRRRYCLQRLDALSDFCHYVKPNGAFYIFVNFSKWLTKRKMSDIDFCKTLLTDYLVGAVPGSTFGKENCARISYATGLAHLEKAFDRIEKLLKS